METQENRYSGIERRRYPRLNINVRVEYAVLSKEPKEESYTKNISAVGICLIIYEDIPPGTILELKIYLPDDNQPISTIGRVVWRSEFVVANEKKPRFDMGIEFFEIDEADRERIARHVFSLLKNK